MVGLTPEEYFRLYEHRMPADVADMFRKLIDENKELKGRIPQ